MSSVKRPTRRSAKQNASRHGFLHANGRERRKKIEKLAREQGIDPATQLQKVLGSGKYLWRSNAEFEKFLHDHL